MDFVDRLLITSMALLLVYVFTVIGSVWKEDKLLNLYCESLSGQYEQIDDIDYCIIDQQLHQIEWVK